MDPLLIIIIIMIRKIAKKIKHTMHMYLLQKKTAAKKFSCETIFQPRMTLSLIFFCFFFFDGVMTIGSINPGRKETVAVAVHSVYFNVGNTIHRTIYFEMKIPYSSFARPVKMEKK